MHSYLKDCLYLLFFEEKYAITPYILKHILSSVYADANGSIIVNNVMESTRQLSIVSNPTVRYICLARLQTVAPANVNRYIVSISVF